MIDYQKSEGVEMQLTVSAKGQWFFEENLSPWAKNFKNGRYAIVDCAGPVRLQEDKYNEIDSEDCSSMDVYTETDSNESNKTEEDSLEKFWNRKRI